MKPLKASIMAMPFFVAYLVSLGGWWLIREHDSIGLCQTVQVSPGEILDIMSINASTAQP